MTSYPTPEGPIEQASAVPFRRSNGSLEFCLITSTKKGLWQFPKGIIDPGETYVETAEKESLEEAGIVGQVDPEPLGSYEYAKWGTSLNVTVVLMEVSRSESTWDEADVRERRWVDADTAFELIEKKDVKRFLKLALKRLDGEKS